MRRTMPFLIALAAVIATSSVPAASAQALAGRWDATLTINGVAIPFRLDVSGEGPTLTGTLFNGDQEETTTSATQQDGALTLSFDHYLTKIVATQKADGTLDGRVEGRFAGSDRYITSNPFSAVRYRPRAQAASNVPRIDGVWTIPYESAKGEKAWRFIVQQTGAEVSAAILRVDGDTGALTGGWEQEKFVLSHFDGSRPFRVEVTPKADGSLSILQTSGGKPNNLVAYRPEEARAKGVAEPADFTAHTTMRDPNEVFAFTFPDVDGNVRSNDDPRFKGKVVVAIVTGTWCPNCHDEAQYLVQLYKKYRARGLEIVALDFEEPEQQDELARVKAFTKKYGIDYTYLIAGAPIEMWEKVPQAVNLNTWPATFFVGRDGRVKKIHAGFAAPASGRFYDELQAEFTSTIERLLAEPANVSATR